MKYDILDKKISEYDQNRPLDQATLRLIQDKLLLEWTYHSNAIEGNTLTYNETSFFLLRGLTAKGKSLEEHLEIENHRDAIQFLESIVSDSKWPITEKLIREIHRILFQNISEIKIGLPGRKTVLPIVGGQYKAQNNHVLKADGTIHYYVNAIDVPEEMCRLVSWIKKNENKIHILELAGTVHYEIARIHPFPDGNGRVARLLMNLIFMRQSYPPLVIRNWRKNEYYDVLELADQGDKKPFFQFLNEEMLNTLDLIMSILEPGRRPKNKIKARLFELRKKQGLTQKDLARISGVSQARISRLENGKENPGIKTKRVLAESLGVEIDDL